MRASAACGVGSRQALGASALGGGCPAAAPACLSLPARTTSRMPASRTLVVANSREPRPAGDICRRQFPAREHLTGDRSQLLGGANNILPAHFSGTEAAADPQQADTDSEQRAVSSVIPHHMAPFEAQPAAEPAPGPGICLEAALGIGTGGSGGSGSGSGRTAKPSPSVIRPHFSAQLDGIHRPVGLVVGSAWLLSTSVQLAGVAALTPLWLPAVAGGLLGGLYSAISHHFGPRRLWLAPRTPLRVVITGGSAGIGKALAREFLRCGDRVLITSRSTAGAQQAAGQLRHEVGPTADVQGVECDVSDPASVDRLMAAAQELLGGVDCLVNNAGYSGSFQSLLDQSPEQVERVVRTNLLGSLLTTRAAMRLMAAQPGGTAGHIFNMEGAGADGAPTPQYAAYGATKAALAQLLRTLQHEAAGLGPSAVCVHNLSPGMVLTDLLLDGATEKNKQIFNILCDHPETVAAFLVPRARSVVAAGRSGAAIRYLTPTRALTKFLAAPLHQGRYFDKHGRPVYLPEQERILGAQARRTQRLQERAARRSGPVQLAYSLSMALSFFLIVSDALAKAPPPLP